ncbi:MAG TPA: hypothetical protein ENK44_11635 [Caldithrix abyssi]|uniref:DUF2490 domain-containing protein n=1 Tax=Caldithrix abyssi TaxID=187145 RepID=A0A7V4U1L8_CALAY|nr:hypothetical protein [Caldithrix abyssi]
MSTTKIITVIVLFFLLVNHSFADRRYYIWTYQYNTISQAETELEFYQTTFLANKDIWEYRLEVEHGLTDRLDFSVYQIFRQIPGESFKWDAVQFRMRYRFGEAGQYFVDPLLYVEYRQRLDASKPKKAEFRLVLAKQLDALNISFNPLYEYFFSPGSVQELGFDLGLSYEFHPSFMLGIEAVSRAVFYENEITTGTYLGPVVSVASGSWWYTFGAGFGMNKLSDTMRIRFIMGVDL